MSSRQLVHKNIYFWLLVILAVSIPLSEYVMSVSQFVIALNWLIEGQYKKKFERIKENWIILFFLALFLIHFIWLINTENFSYAFKDIRIKIPMFTLPILIGSSEGFSFKKTKVLLLFFVGAVLFSSLVSLSILTGIYDYDYESVKNISIFISHIRFSLMIVFSIFILSYYGFFHFKNTKPIEFLIYIIVAIWLLVFLYLLQTLTGIIIFMVIAYILLIYYSLKIRNLIARLFSIVFLITIMLLCISFITKSIARFYYVEDMDFAQLDERTANGNVYTHGTDETLTENGHYVWIYLEENELRKDWNNRSEIRYDSLDAKGQPLKYTLIRYLTSLGLRKDSVGLSKLTESDMKDVEAGIANPIINKQYHPYTIIYKILWEIEHYRQTGNASGHTLTQRLEYLKAASRIIEDNFWTGVGTGDLNLAFKSEYQEMDSELSESTRRRAHNQFITFWVAFGFIGFILSMFFYFGPILISGNKSFLFTVFFLIISISMLNEDTLETQEGVTFVLFFYCIFVSTFKFKREQ